MVGHPGNTPGWRVAGQVSFSGGQQPEHGDAKAEHQGGGEALHLFHSNFTLAHLA